VISDRKISRKGLDCIRDQGAVQVVSIVTHYFTFSKAVTWLASYIYKFIIYYIYNKFNFVSASHNWSLIQKF
jgi:hypothetical protein